MGVLGTCVIHNIDAGWLHRILFEGTQAVYGLFFILKIDKNDADGIHYFLPKNLVMMGAPIMPYRIRGIKPNGPDMCG